MPRPFRAVHVDRSGELTLELPLGHVFPLFSPEGERAWVEGWDPEYLHPGHPSNDPGTVFRTSHRRETTVWLILRYDPHLAEAWYGRFTPGSRAGTVAVRCHDEGPSRTRVTVSYSLTSLSPSGNAVLKRLTAGAYTAMLKTWRTAIHRSQRAALPERAGPR